MGLDAGITITFYDVVERKMKSMYIDCYTCAFNCAKYEIPQNAKSVNICFSTEYDHCSECPNTEDEGSNDSTFDSDSSTDNTDST